MSPAATVATDPSAVFRRHGLTFVALGPHDAARMGGLIKRCTVETQYFRFRRALGNVTTEVARELTDCDGHTRFGLGLVDTTGDLVAAAELDTRPRHVAEFGLLVRDDHQGQGLGTAMMGVLLRHAELLGLRALEAPVLACNRIMLGILARVSPMTIGPMRGGVVRVTLPVSAAFPLQTTA